ncbi:MAG: hypothetical protein D6737_16840 [Chloroflexi bacterium]|nr:MAG: hypothetical protein CUN54_04420 [Phototrophicales bacterium]RMF77727.1 MAG: hypothetical protein D6737_16840 [Chloroflexota bacterium]
MPKWLLGLIVFLAACGGRAAVTETPVANDVAANAPARATDGVPTPTLPPPEWREATTSITLDNAPQISYLGRLDANSRPSTVFDYDFAPDNTLLAALNNDLLIVWDLITGEEILSQERGDAARVLFSADKTELFLIGSTGQTAIIDTTTGSTIDNFAAHPTFNNSIAYYEDDGLLAVGGTDGDVKVWDVFERISLVTIAAHGAEAVDKIAFSHDGERLATGGLGAVHLWNWRDRERIASFALGDALPQHVVFSPDDTQLAVKTQEMLYLLDPTDMTVLHSTLLPRNGGVDLLAYSPDGRFLITDDILTEISIWNTETGQRIVRLPNVGERRVSAAFSPSGDMLLTSSLTGPVTLWNIAAPGEQDVARADLDVEGERHFAVAWTDDGRLLTILDALGPIYVWGIADDSE